MPFKKIPRMPSDPLVYSLVGGGEISRAGLRLGGIWSFSSFAEIVASGLADVSTCFRMLHHRCAFRFQD
jgi:hypothetical protein